MISILKAGLKELGIDPNDKKLELFDKYLFEVIKWNKVINLTAIEDEKERLRIVLRDINSLIEHTNFLFERLEYLQNTFLGLVNIDQNKIIKIFTVVTVVLMPPTLIASLYGMNFKFIPELNWVFGYPFAIGLMISSSVLALIFFKKQKWL